MKATGIVRRIDDLGRVVIPKEIRRTLRIREGDPLEIFVDRDGEVILKKYSPIGELGDFAKEYADSLYEAVGQVEPGSAVLCCVRPEHVTLSANPSPSGSSARNFFAGTIRQITPLGLFHRIRLDCGFDLVAYVTRQSLEELGLAEGKQVGASFKATAVHVILRKEPLPLCPPHPR